MLHFSSDQQPGGACPYLNFTRSSLETKKAKKHQINQAPPSRPGVAVVRGDEDSLWMRTALTAPELNHQGRVSSKYTPGLSQT